MTDDWMDEVQGRVPHRPKRRWWAVAARPAGGTLLLDVLSIPAVASYSFRRLRSSYSGYAVQVKRSSDSTVQNIGFAGNDFDIAGYNAFVGVSTGSLVIWYDQSGNNNASITPAGPVVNLTGANGLPTAVFPAGSDFSIGSPAGAQPYSFNTVAMRTGNFTGYNVPFGDTTGAGIFFNAVANQAVIVAGAIQGALTCADNTLHSITGVFNGGASTINVDATSNGPGSFNPGGNAFTGIKIGGGSGGNALTGTVSEGIAWGGALPATDITTLTANQRAYWHTP